MENQNIMDRRHDYSERANPKFKSELLRKLHRQNNKLNYKSINIMQKLTKLFTKRGLLGGGLAFATGLVIAGIYLATNSAFVKTDVPDVTSPDTEVAGNQENNVAGSDKGSAELGLKQIALEVVDNETVYKFDTVILDTTSVKNRNIMKNFSPFAQFALIDEEFGLYVHTPSETFPSKYSEITKVPKNILSLNKIPLGNDTLWRVRANSINGNMWYYTNKAPRKDCLNAGDPIIKGDCGEPIIKFSDTQFITMSCKAITDEGLKSCDRLVRFTRTDASKIIPVKTEVPEKANEYEKKNVQLEDYYSNYDLTLTALKGSTYKVSETSLNKKGLLKVVNDTLKMSVETTVGEGFPGNIVAADVKRIGEHDQFGRVYRVKNPEKEGFVYVNDYNPACLKTEYSVKGPCSTKIIEGLIISCEGKTDVEVAECDRFVMNMSVKQTVKDLNKNAPKPVGKVYEDKRIIIANTLPEATDVFYQFDVSVLKGSTYEAPRMIGGSVEYSFFNNNYGIKVSVLDNILEQDLFTRLKSLAIAVVSAQEVGTHSRFGKITRIKRNGANGIMKGWIYTNDYSPACTKAAGYSIDGACSSTFITEAKSNVAFTVTCNNDTKKGLEECDRFVMNMGVEVTSKPNTPVTSKALKIYFKDSAKFKQSATNYLTSGYRSTDRNDKYNFLIEEIIKGPTTKEVGLGFVSTFGKGKDAQFTSASSCGGKDFKYTESDGVATVTFCRGISLAGTLSGFVLEDQIVKTLVQFDSINKVIVLNEQGNCFNDGSGQNLCKQ